ncbi:MAG: methyltransferase [Hyphomonadaceae bacterium]|jgi:predicted nicotinamide N-methyase|nr:methyltransferase [Hyphomonadaceae bacterium]
MSVTQRDFILGQTAVLPVSHCPEISLHLAHEAFSIWHATEDELRMSGVPLPFWAFAWAGGQALARTILDQPGWVRGRTVLDMATGSGLVAIAAAKSGATAVTACDIDPFCAEAVALNAALNEASVTVLIDDLVGKPVDQDVILIGDMFYEQPLAGQVGAWAQDLHAAGKTVLIGDPGRAYLPKSSLVKIATHAIAQTAYLEDRDVTRTHVWTFP